MSNTFTTLNINRLPSSTTDRIYYNIDLFNSESIDDNHNDPHKNIRLKNNELDGGSFKDILNQQNKTVKRKTEGIVFHVPYENKIALERAHSAIIIDSLKLIKYHDNNEINLFDVKNDLSESIDLSKVFINEKLIKTKTAIRFEKLLDEYLSEVKAPKWQPGITWKENSLKTINSFH